MGIGGIYEILNTVNGKRYIGSSVNIVQRWHLHRSHLSQGVHHSVVLQRAWDKYGEKVFAFHPLMLLPSVDLILWEQQYLDEFAPAYNICKTAGNCLGVKHTAETRANMSASMTPARRAKIGNQHRGKILSDAQKTAISVATTGRIKSLAERAKLSIAMKGRVFTPETIAKMSIAAKKREKIFGRVHTEETKEKISIAKMGRKHSPEARAKISAGHIGNTNALGFKHSPETRAKVSARNRRRWAYFRLMQAQGALA